MTSLYSLSKNLVLKITILQYFMGDKIVFLCCITEINYSVYMS